MLYRIRKDPVTTPISPKNRPAIKNKKKTPAEISKRIRDIFNATNNSLHFHKNKVTTY